MLKCNFGTINGQKDFVSIDEMLSVFDIYCLDAGKDCYLLIPREGRTSAGCPMFYACEENVETVMPENAPDSRYEGLKKQALSSAVVTAQKLPRYVKDALLNKLSSCLSFENK